MLGIYKSFIKRGNTGLEKIKQDSWIKQTVTEIWFLIMRWQVILTDHDLYYQIVKLLNYINRLYV